jgi:hypothetical protein
MLQEIFFFFKNDGILCILISGYTQISNVYEYGVIIFMEKLKKKKKKKKKEEDENVYILKFNIQFKSCQMGQLDSVPFKSNSTGLKLVVTLEFAIYMYMSN